MSCSDVIVIGGGPAGAATAVFLAQSGLTTHLISRQPPLPDKIGESLSPQANHVLKQLGLWPQFVADGHLPCYGNKSSWGSSRLAYHDFINNPAGHGWHINRALLEQRLLEQATAVKVHLHPRHTVRRADWDGSQWQLSISNHSQPLRSRFVVDATGRSSWLARRQGSQRQEQDKQVALVAFLETAGKPLADSTSLVEAVANGWWYSARLPNGMLAVTFMTDIDLHDPSEMTQATGWLRHLQQAPHTQQRVQQHGYQLANQPHFVAASSGRLNQLAGSGWLAVGDAAMSYDPLSAHGITLALVGGRDAAAAIGCHLQGQPHALASYTNQLNWAYEQYAQTRHQFYRSETRWLTAPYWHRRTRQMESF
jgi:2-polyprenyl-6-methoxyphenol hydroxylase-like FAD-dependent oxidoreductase